MECPYLDTINRQVLDFDFEKVCSQTLSSLNVYCCLVCGKYFQGRGKHTAAYTHSTQCDHHVFINLETCLIYCLPENYEVVDSSLDDISRCLEPKFSPEKISKLSQNAALARDVHGVAYLPGFCGLNNLKRTDYVSVVAHSLSHVEPLRDYFLSNKERLAALRFPLVRKFGELIRKMWSNDNFKSVISPHDFVQEVTVASGRKFAVGDRSDAVSFLGWLLNTLEKQMKPSKMIHDTFRGSVTVESFSRRTHLTKRDDDEDEWKKEQNSSQFLYLTLDIPPTPLFKDSEGGNVIPQIPIYDLLQKYDGVKLSDSVKAGVQFRKRYSITRLPKFLIFHFARFSKNNFNAEKNTTIVTFPIKNLDLTSLLQKNTDDDNTQYTYDLVSNVCHDLPLVGREEMQEQGDPLQMGTFRVHVHHQGSKQWYEIQDLHVSETMPQLIGLSESLMCIYRLRTQTEERS